MYLTYLHIHRNTTYSFLVKCNHMLNFTFSLISQYFSDTWTFILHVYFKKKNPRCSISEFLLLLLLTQKYLDRVKTCCLLLTPALTYHHVIAHTTHATVIFFIKVEVNFYYYVYYCEPSLGLLVQACKNSYMLPRHYYQIFSFLTPHKVLSYIGKAY